MKWRGTLLSCRFWLKAEPGRGGRGGGRWWWCPSPLSNTNTTSNNECGQSPASLWMQRWSCGVIASLSFCTVGQQQCASFLQSVARLSTDTQCRIPVCIHLGPLLMPAPPPNLLDSYGLLLTLCLILILLDHLYLVLGGRSFLCTVLHVGLRYGVPWLHGRGFDFQLLQSTRHRVPEQDTEPQVTPRVCSLLALNVNVLIAVH